MDDPSGYIGRFNRPLSRPDLTLKLYVMYKTAQTIVTSKIKDWATNAWGMITNGPNQGAIHFTEYWSKYPDRIPSIARRLGLDVSYFSKTEQGFRNFTSEALKIIKNPTSQRSVGDKIIYFKEGVEKLAKGVVLIVREGKIQSMMPSDMKSFLRMK
jgi:hypothetical protein